MKIEIRVIEARDLKMTDFFSGRSDPYVKVSAGGQVHKTAVAPRTCNPQWNEAFTFDILPGQTVTFEVFSFDDVGTDEYLGSTTYGLTCLSPGQVIDRWMLLTKKGQIHIQLLLPGSLSSSVGVRGFAEGAAPGDSRREASLFPATANTGRLFFGYSPSFQA